MTVTIEGCKIGMLQEIVIAVIILDTILGVLQAIKTKKFNSSFGTNGVIRKIAMIATIVTMIFVDQVTAINLISFVPKEILSVLSIEKVGLADFFSLLYILFECVSILKNMSCLKLPVFQKMNVWIENILTKFIGDTKKRREIIMTTVIAIDAGHGHYTPGRTSDKRYDVNQTHEWDLNNRLANLEEQYLKEYDVMVIRLDDRTGVRDVSLRERTNLANAKKCDFVISNHHNAGGGNGLESFYDKRVNINSSEYQMYKQIHQEVILSTTQKNRGLKSSSQSAPGDLAILRDTKMPAILIEAGFMDNASDTPRIISEEFASKYARGVVNGLVKVLQLKKVTNGTTNSGSVNQGYQGNSIVDYLNSIGENSSFSNRALLAKQYGIVNYTGTASQNILLLNKLRNGTTVINYYPAIDKTSIVDALKGINVDSSIQNRSKIATVNGITNYTGTANQNMQLLTLLKQGKLKRA